MLQPALPEHLPGEPLRGRPGDLRLIAQVLLRAPLLLLLAALCGPLWLPFGLGLLVWGWPPNIPSFGQVARYGSLIWTVSPLAPGLSLPMRLYLSQSVLRKVLVMPLWGLCWFVDLLLFGRQLAAIRVERPLLEISAARSGSTQIARYLEADPELVAPSFLQFVFPYRWLWWLAPRTLGRVITPEQVRHKMEQMVPPEFVQRHEGDPFRTDTLDGALYLAHLNHLSPFLGPRVLADEFGFASAHPAAQALIRGAFVELIDAIGRKTLLHAGPGPDGRPRRLFMKGHFIGAAAELERRFPDACFLTVVRHPLPRLQSAINFLRANPIDPVLGPPPWGWLVDGIVESELRYGAAEQAFFTAEGSGVRCVVRFTDFVQDLEGTMGEVYRRCFGLAALPAHVPRVHEPRKRTDYLLNRSLSQLGIDEAALVGRFGGYIDWIEAPRQSTPVAQAIPPAASR